ncbi:Sensor-like histidine kinase RcsD [Serratia odorifera]|uniref:Sensor-like histidine kinase RcsD n=1 Tax=Serratia odorifera TaxID=618 RepID=A0A3S4DM56_SEROD|nr:Sensor-like histidine kinase RcsD [Serratia odorifera]
MQNKQLIISSSNITRCFLVFIVLLFVGIGLYGYNYTNAYLTEKKHALNTIAGNLQKRIDNYRHITYQIYDRFGNAPPQVVDPTLRETRLRPDIFYVEKPYKKTDAVIFGSHDGNTLGDDRQYFRIPRRPLGGEDRKLRDVLPERSGQ